MPKYLNQIKALKKINKSIVTNNKFLINKEGNIKIYYAPFDYINSSQNNDCRHYPRTSTNAAEFSSNK